jgi:hypothetical protein
MMCLQGVEGQLSIERPRRQLHKPHSQGQRRAHPSSPAWLSCAKKKIKNKMNETIPEAMLFMFETCATDMTQRGLKQIADRPCPFQLQDCNLPLFM